MMPPRTAPKNGDASTAIERATASTPTPTRNTLDAPERLLEKPSMILAIPFMRNAIAMNIIMIRAVAIGNDMARPAKIITSTPRPMLVHLVLLGEKIPTIISSIPTNNKTKANIQTTEIYVNPGKARTTRDRAIVSTPRLICTARTQDGLFYNDNPLNLRDSNIYLVLRVFPQNVIEH